MVECFQLFSWWDFILTADSWLWRNCTDEWRQHLHRDIANISTMSLQTLLKLISPLTREEGMFREISHCRRSSSWHTRSRVNTEDTCVQCIAVDHGVSVSVGVSGNLTCAKWCQCLGVRSAHGSCYKHLAALQCSGLHPLHAPVSHCCDNNMRQMGTHSDLPTTPLV